MSALRMVKRTIAGRSWYRLVRLDGRLFAGGLRSPVEASSAARQGRHHILGTEPAPAAPLRKETAPCCLAKRLPDGRPVLGFCGPECMRRPAYTN